MLSRRSFLAGVFAAASAPAIVRSQSLMMCRGILVPQYTYSIESTWYGGIGGGPECESISRIWANGKLLYDNTMAIGMEHPAAQAAIVAFNRRNWRM